MRKEITYNRRHFLNNAFITFGAAELSMIGLESKQFIDQNFAIPSVHKPGNNKSFDQFISTPNCISSLHLYAAPSLQFLRHEST